MYEYIYIYISVNVYTKKELRDMCKQHTWPNCIIVVTYLNPFKYSFKYIWAAVDQRATRWTSTPVVRSSNLVVLFAPKSRSRGSH